MQSLEQVSHDAFSKLADTLTSSAYPTVTEPLILSLIGAFAGYLLGAGFGILPGLIGAFVGASVGGRVQRHLLRSRYASAAAASGPVREVFFECSFAVMGHVAKADGRVDQSEIALAEALMRQMQLDADRRRAAIAQFNAGKQADFDLDACLSRLQQAATSQPNLLVAFLEVQLQAALADGDIDPAEERVLVSIAERFSVPEFLFRRLETLVRASRERARAGDTGGRAQPRAPSPSELDAAYEILGVSPSDGRETVKSAWRRLMSEHHPDKLMSQGLPPEMMDMATERAQTIQKAWERVRSARGWR